MRPAHTPYDGTSRPFTIGLKPLDPAQWIEVDELREAYIAEKRRLYAQRSDDVFMAQADTHDAQEEVLALLTAHMGAHFPAIVLPFREPSDPPLKTASLMVQEDLVLMRKGPDGWLLAAASLCFPSSWTLAEKFGRPLADIHAPVPDFGRATRNAALIERMFDNLQGQSVMRWNWSLQDNPDLYHPLSHDQRAPRRIAASAFIRVERQTLRKLPRSGDILFTIRIHLDPLHVLASHADGARLADAFAGQLAALDGQQLAYKGLADARDDIVSALRDIAHNR